VDKVLDEVEDVNGELVTNKIIEALVLLKERTRTSGESLEQIGSRISELSSMGGGNSSEGAGKVQTKMRPQGYKCKMGRAILALGILGIVTSVRAMEVGVQRYYLYYNKHSLQMSTNKIIGPRK
jgi:hypothetical protein